MIELINDYIYEPIWRFFELIHNFTVNCVAGTWDWIVEKLRPYIWAISLFNLTAVLLLLVVLLRRCFQ
jgi:hypothetical protein